MGFGVENVVWRRRTGQEREPVRDEAKAKRKRECDRTLKRDDVRVRKEEEEVLCTTIAQMKQSLTRRAAE